MKQEIIAAMAKDLGRISTALDELVQIAHWQKSEHTRIHGRPPGCNACGWVHGHSPDCVVGKRGRNE